MVGDLIPLAEATGWLKAQGYPMRTRQAIHDAARRGSLVPAEEIVIAGRSYRFFTQEQLLEYAKRSIKHSSKGKQ